MRAVAVDLQARVRMAHAVLDFIARGRGIDLLHVKGPALDASLSDETRSSSDADVLVRPSQVAAMTAALVDHDWRLVTGFERGSAFEHAANHRHEQWGYADLHRSFPGITLAPEAAFDALWAEREDATVAHRTVCVPSVDDQALLLLLHAARGQGSTRAADDVRHAWTDRTDADRAASRRRAEALGAQVALAAAIGELEQHADDRTADLWRFYSEGGSRLDELRARLRAAPDVRSRLRVAATGLRLNEEYVEMALGHPPTPEELAAARRERVRRAGADVLDVLRSRLRRGRARR